MHWLDYFLSTPTALKKTPYLVLVGLDAGVEASRATADDVLGAVLLFEYQAAGHGLKVFATDDVSGWRTVIAPAEIRLRVAETACRVLMEAGAVTAMISLEGSGGMAGAIGPPRGWSCLRATRTRQVPRYLPLADTLEATLATLGKHTRRNLRYYRRRLEAELSPVFVPCVAMERDEFLAINRGSMNPVAEELAEWRYDSTHQTPGAFFAGLQAADGRWLSLVGGRRYMQVTEIDWQVNLAGMARHSLSTVMRCYILEHEIELGTKELAFTGGTPHSMRHSFVAVEAVDVIVRRQSLAAWLLRTFARRIFPEKNFLRQALGDASLHWTKW